MRNYWLIKNFDDAGNKIKALVQSLNLYVGDFLNDNKVEMLSSSFNKK